MSRATDSGCLNLVWTRLVVFAGDKIGIGGAGGDGEVRVVREQAFEAATDSIGGDGRRRRWSGRRKGGLRLSRCGRTNMENSVTW